MSEFIGANPDDLDRLASAFINASRTLGHLRGEINARLHTAPWIGEQADEFRAHWNSRHQPILTNTASMLNAGAVTLRANAQQQIDASSAAGAGSGSAAYLNSSQATNYANNVRRDAALVNLEGKKSPAEQQAWWNSLSAARQNELIATVPALLLKLNGLPKDAKTSANEAAVESYRSAVSVSADTLKVSGSVDIKYIEIGGKAKIVKTLYENGNYTVTLSEAISAGVGAAIPAGASAQIAVQGESSKTYTFANAHQAQIFENGLRTAAIPTVDSILTDPMLIADGPLGISEVLFTASAIQVAHYLNGYHADLTSDVLSGSLKESTNINVGGPVGGASVSVAAETGVKYDTVTHETTAFIDASGSVQANVGPVTTMVSGDAQAAVTWGPDGQVLKLEITGTYSAGEGVSIDPALMTSNSGHGGSFQINVDMTDPANHPLVAEYLNALVQHNTSAADQALQQLHKGSEIVIQTDHVSSQQGFGGVVEHTKSVDALTYIKPPNGHFLKV